MLSAISQGFLIGIGLAMLIGPVFFSLINTSINKGVQNAIYLAIGISLSDLFYIALVFIGINTLFQNEMFKYWLGIGGALILIAFGIQSILKKTKTLPDQKINIESKHKVKNILKGFLLNSVHPGVVFFWLATVGGILGSGDFSTTENILLFTTTILTTFACDLIKIKLASKLSQYLNPFLIRKLNIGIGTILVCSGIYLGYITLMGQAIIH